MTTTNLSFILASVEKILTQDPHLFSEFQALLRENIASLPLAELLSGTITATELTKAISASCEALSLTIITQITPSTEQRYRSYADQIWNPLVSALLNRPSAPLKVKAPTHLPKPISQPGPSGLPNNASQPLMTASLNHEPMDELTVQSIQTSVRTYRSENSVLYRNAMHIKCTKPECAFCIAAFTTLNLTRCVDHIPCTKLGWFPHIGKPLWKRLRPSHDRGLPYRPKKVEPKAGEILSPWTEPVRATTPTQCQLPETQTVTDDDLSRDSTASQEMSYSQPGAWATIVERSRCSPAKRRPTSPIDFQ